MITYIPPASLSHHGPGLLSHGLGHFVVFSKASLSMGTHVQGARSVTVCLTEVIPLL